MPPLSYVSSSIPDPLLHISSIVFVTEQNKKGLMTYSQKPFFVVFICIMYSRTLTLKDINCFGHIQTFLLVFFSQFVCLYYLALNGF